MQLSRRAFLTRSAALGAGAVLLRGAGPGGVGGLSGLGWEALAASRFDAALPVPSWETASDIVLRAAEADVALLPGAATRMWTFNGVFPGPFIRRPSGAATRLTVVHSLPAEAGSLTIHHHGNHSPSSEDGQPERNVIEPGGSRTYVYDMAEDGGPQRGALRWYHDHSHMRTGRNVWMGLLGLFLLDDGFEDGLGLPGGPYELPLLITDRRFDAANQLVYSRGAPPYDAVTGDVVLVNGAPTPHVDVEARRYRLRVLNASGFSPYNLSLRSGAVGLGMTQIGNESGLLPAAASRPSVLLGPAERADLVVDFAGLEGQSVVMGSASEASSVSAAGAVVGPVMEFRVGPSSGADDSAVPSSLRPLPAWAAALGAGSPAVDRVWTFGLGLGPDGALVWTVNGRPFDPARVDARPRIGTVETWMLVNTSGYSIPHYIHIHDVSWRMLSRNFAAPPPGEDGLKETFRLDPGDVVVVAGKFTDHLGPYMLHCHMLDHEDSGMMATFEVVPHDGLVGSGSASFERALHRLPEGERARTVAVVDAARRSRQAAPLGLLASLPVPRVDAGRWTCPLPR